MPGTRYTRRDFAITIRRAPDGGALLQSADEPDGLKLPPDALAEVRATPGNPSGLLAPLVRRIAAWSEALPPEDTPLPPAQARTLGRVVLHVDDLDLATVRWEIALAPEAGVVPFVRVAPTRARIAEHPLALPLRILEVILDPLGYLDPFGDPPPNRIADFVKKVSQSLDASVVQTETARWPPSVESPPRGWPTVDILHVSVSGMWEFASRDSFSWTDPTSPGSLGWFRRITEAWQTRLLVLEGWWPTLNDLGSSILLAARLAALGGPAVIVMHRWDDEALQEFYAALIHDAPLDEAARRLSARVLRERGPVYYLGGGREELLRVSAIAERLASAQADALLAGELLRRWPAADVAPARETEFRASLTQLRDEFRGPWNFDLYESGGLIPLARRVETLRRSLGERRPAARSPFESVRPPEPRYVQGALWRDTSEGEFERIAPARATLRPRAVVHLGVQIGALEEEFAPFDAAALVEEVFRGSAEKEGVWVEVGVTGIDFDVTGAALQEVWLPREGATDTVFFAVAPRGSGVARLRYCLYYNHQLLQSFRLAAVVAEGGEAAEDVSAELAAVLDIPRESVGDRGYASRLEYGATPTLEAIERTPRRSVNLVANHSAGVPVITVKGDNLYDAYTDANLPKRVAALRAALEDITGVNDYAFGTGASANRGDDAKLQAALMKLAALGWPLYQSCFSQDTRARLAGLLNDARAPIQVGHILLDHVIPWAAIYDRPYDPRNPEAERGVCTACLPADDGAMPVIACGSSSRCLLHPDRLRQREAQGLPLPRPETVVCPQHFWGFRHVIEIPPQQAGVQGAPPEPRLSVACEPPDKPSVLAAVHPKLDFADRHVTELRALLADLQPALTLIGPLQKRSDVLDQLTRSDPQVVYFYCHTERVPNEIDPFIFVDAGVPPMGFTPSDLCVSRTGPWGNHPLVFLNGCQTAGFTPDALSPFIQTLVRDCGAAGVVGTEVTVWEVLAEEVAIGFLEAFLKGQPAGEALQGVRRRLLAKRNPLGLVYTLYASAELRLDHPHVRSPVVGAPPTTATR